MQEVIVQGRNLEEALKQASSLLNAKGEDIEFQILDPGSSGLLGRGERPLVIRAWPRKGNAHPLSHSREQPSASVEGGKLKVAHSEGGPYPIVVPCRGVKLLVNGKEFVTAVPVSKNDAIVIETINEWKQGSWVLEITPDRMKAILHLLPALVL